jgi:uncharacterized membrane protein
MKESPLENQADHQALQVLRDAGLLRSDDFWAGIRVLNETQAWARWAQRLCLLLGSALMLAGLVFFFAFNWDALGRWQKLGLLQGITLLALVGGQFVGFHRIGGQLLLMAAAISVGVGFAVFGQVYQTGADAFGFFALWAVCITPWVAIGAFAPLWVLWLTLLNLSVWFFWDQVGQFHSIDYSYVCIALTLINGGGLIARERLVTRYTWLQGEWLRPLCLLGALIPLLIPALNLILDTRAGASWPQLMVTALWLLSVAVSFRYYSRIHYDSTALCILLTSVATYLLFALGRLFAEAKLYESGAGFLLMTLCIGGTTALLVRVMRMLKKHYGSKPGRAQ